MKCLFICCLFLLTLGDNGDSSEEEDYSEEEDESGEIGFFESEELLDFLVTGKSTPPPPLYKGSGLNDMKIEDIPLCWEDSDNEENGRSAIWHG